MLPVWLGSVRLKGAAGTTSAPYNALDPRAWPGVAIDPGMLTRARDTRTQFLNSPLSRMNGVKLRLLMSRAWPTANQLIVENGAVSVGAATEPGDTLVPADTTLANEAQVEQAATHQFGGNQDTMKHSTLCVDPFVAAEVASFLDQ